MITIWSILLLLSLVQNKIVCVNISENDAANKVSVNSLVRFNEELANDLEDESSEKKSFDTSSIWNDVSYDYYYMADEPPPNQPQPGQKSLVITFDTTGSMTDDLEELKKAAVEIITHATSQPINPFYNYIFVPFDDPVVGPRITTNDRDELLRTVKNIGIKYNSQNYDCPEMALGGIQTALEKALPKSTVYVFTDADAKDVWLLDEVVKLVQNKQATITVLLGEGCKGSGHAGLAAFAKLAKVSNGNFFNVGKTGISAVMKAIKDLLNINRASIYSKDFHNTNRNSLTIDSGMDEFAITVGGANRNVELTDPNNNTVVGHTILDTDTAKIIKVENPKIGQWIIIAKADGAGSIRVSAVSPVGFQFGFSTAEPEEILQTYVQPLKGAKNYLAAASTNTTSGYNLTHVTIESSDGSTKKYDLKQLNSSSLFVTDPFMQPNSFKIILHGFDDEGNPLERLISTSLEPVADFIPIVNIEVQKVTALQYTAVIMKCSVNSLSAVTIQWKKNGVFLEEKKSKQSFVLEHKIEEIDLSDAGKYTCEATNHLGRSEDSAEIIVQARPPPPMPIVKVTPKEIRIVEGNPINLRCDIERHYLKTYWKFNTTIVDSKFLTAQNSILIEKSSRNHSGKYTCIAVAYRSEAEDSTDVVVEYETILSDPSTDNITKSNGHDVDLTCRSEGEPTPTNSWFFQASELGSIRQNLNTDVTTLSMNNLTFENDGEYVCEANNGIGKIQMRTIQLNVNAKAAPMLHKMYGTSVDVKDGENFTLLCECESCKPIRKYSWSSETTGNITDHENMSVRSVTSQNDKFELNLFFQKLVESNTGVYKCDVANDLGADTLNVYLNVLIKPTIIEIVAKDVIATIGGIFNVTESKAASFECIVKGNPSPDVKWYKNGVIFADSSIITFTSSGYKDAGMYTCQASNHEEFVTKSVNLVVIGPPKLLQKPLELVSVSEGRPAEIKCEVEAFPPANVKWIGNGKEINFNKTFFMATNNSLIFTASANNYGIYECFATNVYGNISKVTSLTVYKIPVIYPATDEIFTAYIRNSVVLKCNANAYPSPDISWTFEGKEILPSNNHVVIDESNLKLKVAERVDAGNYTCIAKNVAGVTSKTYQLLLNESPTITTEFKTKISKFFGQPLNITCSAIGFPLPNVYWLKNDGTNASKTNSLEWSAIEIASYEKYTCYAENSVGNDSRSAIVQTIVPPKLERFNETTIKAKAGDNLTLFCNCEFCLPMNFYSWSSKMLANITDDENMSVTLITSNPDKFEMKLNFQNLVESNNGVYKCDVSNDLGNDTLQIVLDVLVKPTILSIIDTHVIKTKDYFTANDGGQATFECITKGNPIPTVQWYKNGVPFLNSSYLNLTSCSYKDAGIYTCHARSTEGLATETIILKVNGPPTLLGEPIVLASVADGEHLEIKCEIEAFPLATIKWLNDGDEVDLSEMVVAQNNSLLFTAKISDTGIYECVASNDFGSVSKSTSLSVYKLPVINQPTNSNISARIKDEVVFKCDATAEPSPKIFWTFNGQKIKKSSKLDMTDKRSIKLFKAQLTDEGDYSCIAKNSAGKASITYKLFIILPPKITSFQNKLVATINKNFTISCTAVGSPIPALMIFKDSEQPVIFDNSKFQRDANKWIRISANGTTLPTNSDPAIEKFFQFFFSQSTKTITGQLIFLNIKEEDKGKYNCRARSPPNFNSEKAELVINAPPYVDTEKNITREIEIVAGNKLVLTCPMKGNPQPTISWLHNTLPVPIQYTFGKDLQKSNVELSDSGSYECIGVNSIGSAVLDYTVNVFVPAKILKPKKRMRYANKGDNVTLSCASTGVPVPTIRWMEINADATERLLSQQGSIMQVQVINDSSNYKCVVSNSKTNKNLEKFFTVIVVKPPILVKPKTEYPIVDVGQTLILDCILVSTVNTSISWKKNGIKIETIKNKLKWESNFQLMSIANVLKADEGRYKCEAVNLAGKVYKEFFLAIKAPPSEWSEFLPWSSCSVTCGDGIKYRKRYCMQQNELDLDENCPGSNEERAPCNIANCRT